MCVYVCAHACVCVYARMCTHVCRCSLSSSNSLFSFDKVVIKDEFLCLLLISWVFFPYFIGMINYICGFSNVESLWVSEPRLVIVIFVCVCWIWFLLFCWFLHGCSLETMVYSFPFILGLDNKVMVAFWKGQNIFHLLFFSIKPAENGNNIFHKYLVELTSKPIRTLC